jgi:putative flippase GtrA
MILTETKERVRFMKFAVVGTIGAVVDFGIANLLAHFFNMPLVYAGTISFICAIISNFLFNRYWTYPDSRSRHLLHQLGMFVLVSAAGIAIRIPILHFVEPPLENAFKNMMHVSTSLVDLLARNLTLAIAVGVVMIWNFFVNRYWTYNDVE